MLVDFPIPVLPLSLLDLEIPVMIYEKSGNYIVLPLVELDNDYNYTKYEDNRNYNLLK